MKSDMGRRGGNFLKIHEFLLGQFYQVGESIMHLIIVEFTLQRLLNLKFCFNV